MATVLVVDDTDVHRDTLAGLLRRRGHETMTAGGAEHAILMLREAPRPSDLILVDVKMPGLSGSDLLEMLHGNPAWRPVPVVMMTGYSDTHCLNRAAQLGAKRCLVKAAFSAADVMAYVQEYAN